LGVEDAHEPDDVSSCGRMRAAGLKLDHAGVRHEREVGLIDLIDRQAAQFTKLAGQLPEFAKVFQATDRR
jgi:hypothetical protein